MIPAFSVSPWSERKDRTSSEWFQDSPRRSTFLSPAPPKLPPTGTDLSPRPSARTCTDCCFQRKTTAGPPAARMRTPISRKRTPKTQPTFRPPPPQPRNARQRSPRSTPNRRFCSSIFSGASTINKTRRRQPIAVRTASARVSPTSLRSKNSRCPKGSRKRAGKIWSCPKAPWSSTSPRNLQGS